MIEYLKGKISVCILLFIIPLFCFAQNNTQKQINKYLTLEQTEKGYFFKANNGNQSKTFTYVTFQSYGFVETIIFPPIAPNEIMQYDHDGKRGYDNAIRESYHILELMKDLKIIDEYGFKPFTELKFSAIRDGKIDDFGYASKAGKYAMVSNQGEFLTDFKYNQYLDFESNKPLFTNYTNKGQTVSVVLDKFTGKELLATKDSLLSYWDTQNYLVKTRKNKYYLTYQSKQYEVPEIWRYVENLSIESSLFTYKRYFTKEGLTFQERGFITLDGQKIKPENEIIPYTNFYKGHCIAVETFEEEQELDRYGKPFPQRQEKVLKIINENFETVKVLDEVSYITNRFNAYGQIIVENKKKSENNFVIDYLGNPIISPSGFPNRIKEVYEGLYEITDRTYPATLESTEQENFYNQKGEKLINPEIVRITRNIKFKEGPQENYLTSQGFKMITMDKENNVTNSYYK